MQTVERMHYGRYKKYYSDCDTVPESYDKLSRSIEVVLPDGRKKPSGVRGKRFHGYHIGMIDQNGEHGFIAYRAVSAENAMKRHIAWCKKNGWTLGEVESVFC